MKFNVNKRNDNRDYNSDYFDSFLNNFFDTEDFFENKTEYTSNKEVEILEVEIYGDYSNPQRDTNEAVLSKDLLFTVYTNGNFRFKAKNLDGKTVIDQYGELRQSQYYEKNSNYCFDMEIIDKRKGKSIFGLITKRKNKEDNIKDKDLDLGDLGEIIDNVSIEIMINKYFRLESKKDNGDYTFVSKHPVKIDGETFDSIEVVYGKEKIPAFKTRGAHIQRGFKANDDFIFIGFIEVCNKTGDKWELKIFGEDSAYVRPGGDFLSFNIGTQGYFFVIEFLKENDKVAYSKIDDTKNIDTMNYFLSNYFKKTTNENNNITYRAKNPLFINNVRYEYLMVSEFRDDSLIFSAWETFDDFKSPPSFQVIGRIILTKITDGKIFTFSIEGDKIKFVSPYHTYSAGETKNSPYLFTIDMRDNVNTLKEDDKMGYTGEYGEYIATAGINMSDIYSGDIYTTGRTYTTDRAYTTGRDDSIGSKTINLGECVIDASQAKIVYNTENKKEEKMKDRFSSFMPAKVKTGEVALTMTGALAVRGKDGNYVSYNKKTKQIEDHMDLVFGEGRIEEMCFLMPTDIKQLKEGDIVNSNGAYCYVEGQDTETGKLTLVNFLTSVREDAVGSENVFTKMSTVRKLVTAFGMAGGADGADGNPMANMLPFMMMSGKDKGGDDSMFKMMMMSQMMGGNMGGDSNGMNPMMMMMFMDKL